MRLITLLLAVSFSFISYAGELEDLIKFANENNPKLKSYENMRKSVQHRADFVKTLPNPQLSFSLNNVEINRLLPRKENPMSGFALYLSQKYVLPSKRKRSSKIFSEKAQEVDVRKEVYRKELEKNLKLLYWEFSYSFEMERILRDIEEEIRSLIGITEEKYRYNKALLSDLILLRVELLRLEEKLSEAKKLRETTLTKIHALAGGKVELKGSPLKLLEFPPSFDPDSNVSVKLFKKKSEVAKREVERAKVEHHPDLLLSAVYMLRPEITDLLTLRVGITLPVWYSSRERVLVLEKSEAYRSRLLELENVKLQVSGDFEALRSEYSIDREILETIRREIAEKRKEISALLIAYEYDRTDIREILRAYRMLWSLEFEEARILKRLNQTVAKAEALQ